MKKEFPKIIFTLLSTLVLTFLFTTLALPEDITFTTYYPAPFGVYQEIRSERVAIGANYSDSSQYCWPGGPCASANINSNTDLIVEGNVGIGVIDPKTKLDVNGTIKLGSDTCGSDQEGSIQYNSGPPKRMQFCDGSTWQEFEASEGSLGTWATRSSGTTYLASTDGFTLATGGATSVNIAGYTDGSNPPTTRRITTSISPAAGEIHSFMMPVRKGNYWRVTNAITVWWIPLGT